jgi:hypothetical protein
MTVVAKEVAESEFSRFIEAMDLDIDSSSMDAEDLKSFESAKRKILRAIERGQLVIDDKGQPVFAPQMSKTEPITFYEPTGASFMAMDAKKKGHDVAKMFSVMADMTRRDIKTFSQLANRDFQVCQAIVMLFLG